MNSLVAAFRQNNPDDTTSDEDVMRGYVERFPAEQLAQYPDFLADWQKVQQQQAVEGSSMWEEAKKGFGRGVTGLESTAAGAGALAADVLGFQGAKTSLLDIYKRKQQEMATEEAPSVPTVQQALTGGPRALGQYVAGQGGAFVPNVAEALTFAAAGSLAAPGPGTEAGAAAGFFGRIAARSALKKIVEGTLDAAGKKELEEYAAGKVLDTALSEPVAKVVKQASGHLASIGASAANFAALGAGGSFGELSGTEGVTPEGARTGAAIAGAGASLGALIPERIIKSMFGEKAATDAVRTWIDSKAVTVPKELLVAGGGMGAMEFFNILGERYADPKKRDTDFTKDEYSRMLNAVASGILMGTPAAGITALRGGPTSGWVPAPKEEPAPPEAPPAGSEGAAPPPPAPEPGEVAAPSVTPPAPPRVDPVMESRRLLLEAQRKASVEIAQSDRKEARANVTVPETPEEERTTVTEEIRKNEARTIREIHELFPKSELSREQARELRDAAWGKADQHVAETYGQITEEQRLVFLEIANKEVAGTLTDADRSYVQQLSAGQREQYKLIREGVEDATITRGKKQVNVLGERIGNDAQLQKEAQDREHAAKDKEKGDANSASGRLQQAARELDPAKQEALRSIGLDPDTLTAGAATAEAVPPETSTPVDAAIAKARAKSLEERPVSERQVRKTNETKAQEKGVQEGLLSPTPAAAPVPVEAGAAAPKAPWLSSVPEAYNAWHVPVEGKEKTAFFGGMETDGNNKELTNSLGVFETPSGRIAVSTIKKTGRPRKERVQISAKEAKSWDDAVKAGWKPLGVIRTGETKQGKVFHLYTKEEWAPIQAELQGRAERGRSAVVDVAPTPPAVVVEAGLREEGGHPSDTPRGDLTASDAARIHELVIEHVGGIPKSEDVREMVSDAIVTSPEIQARLRDIAGQKDVDAIARVLDRIFEVYERASESGETDPTKLQSQITRELAGISSAKAKGGSQPPPSPPSDVRSSIPHAGDREPGSPGNVDIAQHIVQRLLNAGFTVDQIHGNLKPMVNGVARSMGSFDRATKAVTWSLSDATSPNNLDMRVLVEEVAHALFDRESPEAQQALLKAVSEGFTPQISPAEMQALQADIANAYPEGIRPEVYQEELVAGYMTRKLQAQGFNPVQAQGIGRAIVRLLKDVYNRALMWVQQTLLGKEYDNPDLALRYFENRLKGFLAGDQETLSYLHWLGGGIKSFGQQLAMHTAIGPQYGIESVNAVSGEMEHGALVQDSTQAALLNVGNDRRFSVPISTAPDYPPEDRSREYNLELSVANKVAQVHDTWGQSIGRGVQKLQAMFGLRNTGDTRVKLVQKAQLEGLSGVNPNQLPDQFSNEVNWGPAFERSQAALSAENAKISGIVERDKAALPILDQDIDRKITEGGESLKQYVDSDILAAEVASDFKKMSREQMKSVSGAAYDLGGVEQEMADLMEQPNRPLEKAAVDALQRLFTGDELQGARLYNLLDHMANDDAIDFSKPASQIRADILARAEQFPDTPGYDQAAWIEPYQRLSSDTLEGKALLSAVIYYAKANDRLMANLEMRRMLSGEEREMLVNGIKDLWKETNQQIAAGIKDLTRSASIADRAKVAYRKVLRDVIRLKDHKAHMEDRIATGESALPWYDQAMDEIAARIKDTVPFAFETGAVVEVPKTLDAKPSFDQHTLSLSVREGKPTTPDEIRGWVEQQSAWLKDREAAYAAGDRTAMGRDYQRIKRQRDDLARNVFYKPIQENGDRWSWELVMSSVAKQAAAFGLPAPSRFATRIRQYAGENISINRRASREFGWKASRLMNQTMAVLKRGGRKIYQSWYETYILDKAEHLADSIAPVEGLSEAENLNLGYGKIQKALMADKVIRPIIEDRLPEFMAALREQIDMAHEATMFFSNENAKGGLLVKSGRLGGGRERTPFATGFRVIARKINPRFRAVADALGNSFWFGNGQDDLGAYGDFAKVAQLMKDGKEAEAAAIIARYTDNPSYGDTVKKDFLYEFTHVPKESIFDQPVMPDGVTKLRADPRLMAQAYDESNGNLLETFKRAYALHGGTTGVEDYVQSQLLKLAGEAKHMKSVLIQVEPGPSDVAVSSLKGAIPNHMIDARSLGYWPPSYFTHHRYDRNDIARISQSVAAQKVFGRDSVELAADHKAWADDVRGMKAKLGGVLERAVSESPSGKRQEIDRKASAILAQDPDPRLKFLKTGEDRLKYLRKMADWEPFVKSSRDQLVDYFQHYHDPVAGLRWGVWAARTLGQQLINNPASALNRLIAIADIPVQWGVSRLTTKLVVKTLGTVAKDALGSLANAVGMEGPRLSIYEQMYADGFAPSDVERHWGDVMAQQTGEAARNKAGFNPLRAARLFSELQSAPLRLGKGGTGYTPFRPGALYSTMFDSVNRAFTVRQWEMAWDLVGKGTRFLESHPGTKEISAEDIGLKGAEKLTFNKWKQDIENHGLIYRDLVTDALAAKKAGGKPMLSPETLRQLYSIGLHEVQLESSIATTPLKQLISPLWRFITPLVGWHFRRTMQIPELRLNDQQKASWRQFGLGFIGLAATGLGGLGVGLLGDWFQEEAFGKRRNLARLRVPVTAEDWIAINERLARAGTFGLWGELANTAINVGTGQGDNRALSVDQRVVGFQAFQGILQSMSALVNQNFDPDYAHVVRPLIYTLGGSAGLQYMDIANRALSLDNAESRFITRLNAENYLRIYGREAGLPVRISRGGYATPTPITPWIARMEYAAYGNDPVDFRENYRAALEQAKRAGKPDPVDYVKRAFETRHPLRAVFSQTLSDREYREMLGNLNDRGRESVTEAVRLFNYYGAHIGLTPFDGSKKKDQPRPNAPERARAMALTY